MAGNLKKSTFITGLAVAKTPHYTLGTLYNKILKVLNKMPANAAYRKYTEEVINQRAEVLKSTKDIPEIEKRICSGQVEELIIQAENELLLARKMLSWKPWEPLVGEAPATQWTWPPVKS